MPCCEAHQQLSQTALCPPQDGDRVQRRLVEAVEHGRGVQEAAGPLPAADGQLQLVGGQPGGAGARRPRGGHQRRL